MTSKVSHHARRSPVAAIRFGISIDGVEIASFSELQGISTEIDVIELNESTDDGVRVIQVAGRPEAPTMTSSSRWRWAPTWR